MAKLVRRFRGPGGSSGDRLRNYSIGRMLVVAIFVCVLAVAPALGQSIRGRDRALEQAPPRPEHGYKPWPWFVAFILLGLAWYPAFKNSKRELNE